MNDLQLDLSGAAETFDLPPGDASAVMERGRARIRRRQRLVATATIMALVGTSVAGLRLIAGGDPTTTLAAGSSAMRLDDGAVAWELVEGTSVLSLVQQNPTTASPSGRLYALSTAPGEADLGQPWAKVVWQSDDGVDWAAAPLSDDIFLSDLAASDDRIYAVGTGPATAAVAGDGAVPDVVVGWSDDGAGSWQTAPLAIDLPAIAEASRSVSLGQAAAVAATPAGTVASVTILADLDVPRLLPDGVTAPDGWAITSAGVDLLGPATETCPEGGNGPEEASEASAPGRVWSVACVADGGGERILSPQEVRGVTASFTWEELGVTGDLRRAVLGQPLVFAAEPGGTAFERVELPVEGLRTGQGALHGDDDGFLLVLPGSTAAGASPETVVLRSTDGRSWAETDTMPGRLSRINAAGRVGETFVLLGADPSGEGTVVTGTAEGWSAVSLGDLLGVDGGDIQLLSAAVGPEGIVATVSGFGAEGQERFDPHVLVSADATTWSAQPVAELIDEPVASLGQPVITGDRVVVPVAAARPRDPGEHLHQVALVATLP